MPNTKKVAKGNNPSAKLLEIVINSIEDSKAEDIITIDLKGKSGIADSMIICSGRSSRQVSAIADTLYRALKQNGYENCHLEGQKTNDWVLVDAIDVIVHVFRPEVRSFYNLEKMWQAHFRPENKELPNAQSIADSPDAINAEPIAQSEEDFKHLSEE